LSRAFVEHFVEPCGSWPFSTNSADKVHDNARGAGFIPQGRRHRRTALENPKAPSLTNLPAD